MDITAFDVSKQALKDQDILQLANSLAMRENHDVNKAFPMRGLAKVTITLEDDQVCIGDWVEPKWDATKPPSALKLKD